MQRRGEPFLEIEGVTVDERDVEALRAIDEHGSMNRAASALGRSYARIQQRVADLEETLGPLVTRQRGGAGGGGSTLTENARELLAQFERLRAEFSGLARTEESVLSGTVVERADRLGLVDTDAGTVRAIVTGDVIERRSTGSRTASADADDADDVQVSVRSDAVVLTTPAESPQPAATSVRNQLRGTVREVESEGGLARVTVDIGAATPLVALVTETSLDKLGLGGGDPVVASFKATATRAVPVPEE